MWVMWVVAGEGGGDSMFKSLFTVLKEISDELSCELAENVEALRVEIVDNLLKNHEKYHLKLDKHSRKLLEGVKNSGVVPPEESLMAACEIYNVIIVCEGEIVLRSMWVSLRVHNIRIVLFCL